MLAPNELVLTGVSGGADSVCLALILNELGYKIAISHVNHGLAAAAWDEDERFTAALAQQFALKFFTRRVLLMGGNIEATGRDARKDFFNEVAKQHGFAKIALAHTRNDRVETFLVNLL